MSPAPQVDIRYASFISVIYSPQELINEPATSSIPFHSRQAERQQGYSLSRRGRFAGRTPTGRDVEKGSEKFSADGRRTGGSSRGYDGVSFGRVQRPDESCPVLQRGRWT